MILEILWKSSLYKLCKRSVSWLSSEVVASEGVESTAVGVMMQNQDERRVSYPVGADIFKAQNVDIRKQRLHRLLLLA